VERESIMFINDIWEKQKVSLNVTQSGRYGYFTGHMLSLSLAYEDFIKPTKWHIENCKRFDFDFVERN
jgi:hypothetical protein